jgi:carboxymethylenebutenolidase
VRTTNKILITCLSLLLLGIRPPAARAADIEGRNVTLQLSGDTVTAEFFEAPGTDRRPAVIILHGKRGVGPGGVNYGGVAAALAGAGIDAYVANYYSADDARQVNDPNTSTDAFFADRVRAWSRLISAMADDILARDRSSGRIGLIGFSQGGFLSPAVVNRNRRISAMAVFYGGIPSALKNEISHLPPLIEFHGDADRLVPMADGKALVELARTFGQPAEWVVYHGAGHGFAGADRDDSEHRVTDFFRRHLLSTAD